MKFWGHLRPEAILGELCKYGLNIHFSVAMPHSYRLDNFWSCKPAVCWTLNQTFKDVCVWAGWVQLLYGWEVVQAPPPIQSSKGYNWVSFIKIHNMSSLKFIVTFINKYWKDFCFNFILPQQSYKFCPFHMALNLIICCHIFIFPYIYNIMLEPCPIGLLWPPHAQDTVGR